jgi:hypothetical protein
VIGENLQSVGVSLCVINGEPHSSLQEKLFVRLCRENQYISGSKNMITNVEMFLAHYKREPLPGREIGRERLLGQLSSSFLNHGWRPGASVFLQGGTSYEGEDTAQD